MSVVGEAANGAEAIQLAAELDPSVITLDIDMPVMTGLEALPRLVHEYRQRVVMLSTLTRAHAYPTFKALALGAVDFVTKPGVGSYLQSLTELGQELRQKVRAAARIPRFRIGSSLRPTVRKPEIGVRRDSLVQQSELPPNRIVGIGGSTGATAPLEAVLAALPAASRAVAVVVQHLPPGFSRPFADYLGRVSSFEVKEPVDGEKLQARRVYVAPASAHVRLQQRGPEMRVRLDCTGDPVNGFRPSIDILFYSLALAGRGRAVGVLLSGMGHDGANGLAAIRKLGGVTLCQHDGTCVVPEMPRAAIRLGAVGSVVRDDDLPQTVARLC